MLSSLTGFKASRACIFSWWPQFFSKNAWLLMLSMMFNVAMLSSQFPVIISPECLCFGNTFKLSIVVFSCCLKFYIQCSQKEKHNKNLQARCQDVGMWGCDLNQWFHAKNLGEIIWWKKCSNNIMLLFVYYSTYFCYHSRARECQVMKEECRAKDTALTAMKSENMVKRHRGTTPCTNLAKSKYS